MLNHIGLASFLWDEGKWNKYKHWQIYTSSVEERAGFFLQLITRNFVVSVQRSPLPLGA